MSGFGGYIKENEDVIIEGAWTEIKSEEFRIQRRIPSHFDHASVVVALQAATLLVHRQLKTIMQKVVVGQDDIGRDVTELFPPNFDVIQIAIYKRAIFAQAHSDLLCEFATQDRREAAENIAEDSFQQADRFRRQANTDISLLLGESSNTVALI